MPALKKIGAAALAAFGWTTGGAGAVSASYLVVAGGGSGGANGAGGGGAGGLLTGTTTLTSTLSYTIVIGAGGASAGAGSASNGNNGSNTTAFSLTAIGGGYGGQYNAAGGSGGSGGGGGGNPPGYAGGAGTSGQGNAGGSGTAGTYNNGGGGGGAGAVGSNATSGAGGAGGAGTASSISGSSVTYAGGGGGAGDSRGSSNGAGGAGGGGAAGSSSAGTNGTANTGGGGGAGGFSVNTSGAGGSGIVIISYAGAQQFGGGIVTSVGGNTIHTFTTSGTLSPLSSLSASYLIVAGGGGGGNGSAREGAGGGAGGLLTNTGLTIDTNSTYLVTVGAGGATDVNGSNSTFSTVSTAAVGGGRGDGASGGQVGNGGSGGGSIYFGTPAGNGGTVGTGTSGQGNSGGQGYSSGGVFIVFSGGGGGGAGAVGGTASSSLSGSAGAGGVGVSSSISGTATYYAGGGGGACQQSTTFTSSYTGGAGGNGGGGTGATGINPPGTTLNGGNGTSNTGGGAGGGANTGNGGSGGSGIVIISYAGSTQQMAGGSVTITGGNVIHTFTSSGYLTPLTYYSNSLRFRSSATAYLSRTPTVTSNRKTWTYSAWVKLGRIGTSPYNTLMYAGNTTGAEDSCQIYIRSGAGSGSDQLSFGLYTGNVLLANFNTNNLLRDPAAWYHIVVMYDSTNATSASRLKAYINGQEISYQTINYPALNTDSWFNATTYPQIIGRANSSGGSQYVDGYMSNINFIDGQALTPNSFGTFNSYGVWQPINYGGSYGTNGFYLPFTSGATSSYAGSFSTTNYLSLGGASQLALGSGSWTIEFWYYANAFVTNQVIYEGRPASTNGAYPTFGVTSTGALNFTTNAAVQFASADGTVSLNRWVHIAAVKNGSTTTVYYNGVALGSFSDSITYITGGSAPYICTNAFGVGTYGVNGYVSNLRVVKAAVYTSNFTVPTSPLTNITNTQLLTLQSSTIIDNSSNALTITNTGSVTSPLAYPFNTKVFADQSPQGNNWTPSAVSGVAGSTYDYMTDVPTLTSATAANYAVLNPLDKGFDATTANGNLTFTSSSIYWQSIRASIGVTSGKWYWELNISQNTSARVGITTAATSMNQNYIGLGATDYCYIADNGNKQNNGTASAYGASFGSADIIGVAFDADAGSLTFYKNGASQGVAYSGITSGQYFPAFSVYNTSGISANANFGQRPFAYTPPSGFVALNTYNL